MGAEVGARVNQDDGEGSDVVGGSGVGGGKECR